MNSKKIKLVLILMLSVSTGFTQKLVNQFDGNGNRHGLWTKNFYETNQKRYEGVFKNGKEIDTFKYYTLSNGKSVLSAIKVFNEKNVRSNVQFFASNKKVISEGQMNGKKYIGRWIYYHNNSTSVMIDENYNDDGLLDGVRRVYFKNGVLAELAHYTNGKLNGESKWFSENNTTLRVANYKNDLLHGKIENYDSEGNIRSEGHYNEDQKAGIWDYYDSGELTKKINHTTKTVIFKKQ